LSARAWVSDAILSRDSEGVQQRILSLEKKVQQQDDEIVCLRSSLADALRRLSSLESGILPHWWFSSSRNTYKAICTVFVSKLEKSLAECTMSLLRRTFFYFFTRQQASAMNSQAVDVV